MNDAAEREFLYWSILAAICVGLLMIVGTFWP